MVDPQLKLCHPSNQTHEEEGLLRLWPVSLVCVCLTVCVFISVRPTGWNGSTLLSDGAVQRLCDYVCDLLLEESNVQPVSTPVTVCGDIHGQVGHCLQNETGSRGGPPSSPWTRWF